ncbi:MAG: protein kinase [Planctomycetes bacterium]|nr:protein kinase [Planctomycetota bacterium]MCA8936858.1 protein kinase [Planctomycetota bacterium]
MSERILIADDSRELRTVLSAQLRKLGFDVQVAVDGQDALDRARSFKPTLVIMDIMMPKLSGLRATKKMREDPDLASTPIILMSQLGEEQDVVEGIQAGADEYLVKPFRQAELAARVRILLRKSSGAQKKLDETTAQGLEAAEENDAVRRFKETGQIVSKDFAGFTIIDKLGQGGTATVYRAMEPVNLKPVALKIISPFAAVKEGFLKRLRRSNEIAVRLMHPHIVRTYTMGEYQDVHFMVQELVEGHALDNYLHEENGHMQEAKARRYMLHIAEAIQYLEEKNLIHRDIKPGNIYVSQDDVAKLGDFGLSRLQDDLGQTAEGYLLGTPHYISPEQANGDKHIDSRSDLYSLGATIFHLLSGQPLFPGDNLQQVVLAHLTKARPKLGDMAGDVSPGLCAMVDKLVEREPDARYQTSAELIDAINGLPPLRSLKGLSM